MHAHAHHHTSSSPTSGWVMNLGWRYDAMTWLFDKIVFRGKLRALQARAVELVAPRAGEAVLDVGCGTGALALLARPHVGASGRVVGIDPGPRQIARARRNAEKAGLAIEFQVAVIEHLPFPDRSFDAVTSSLMMHHLPDDVKRAGLAEIARVLRPGGRLAIVDFKRAETAHAKPLGAGTLGLQDLPAIVRDAGFSTVETGDLAMPRIPMMHVASGAGWLLGRMPDGSDARG